MTPGETTYPSVIRSVLLTTGIVAGVALIAIGGGLAVHAARAQQAQPPGITRTDLQRHDLSVQGREVVQARVDLAPGALAPRHTHPGEEIIYVLAGTLEYDIAGRRSRVKAGDVLFVPAGAVHSARNVGPDDGAELATYVVEKGKPLITLVQ